MTTKKVSELTHEDHSIYDINNSLLGSSLGAQNQGAPPSQIENVGDMVVFITEEYVDALITPSQKVAAIKHLTDELNEMKNSVLKGGE